MEVSKALETHKSNNGLGTIEQSNSSVSEERNIDENNCQENSLSCDVSNSDINALILRSAIDKQIPPEMCMAIQECIFKADHYDKIVRMNEKLEKSIEEKYALKMLKIYEDMDTLREELKMNNIILRLMPSDIQEAYVGLKISSKNSQCVDGKINVPVHSFSIRVGSEHENMSRSTSKQGFYIRVAKLGVMSISGLVTKIKDALDSEKYVSGKGYVAKATSININTCLGREEFLGTIGIIVNTLKMTEINNHFIINGNHGKIRLPTTEQGLDELYAINCFYFPVHDVRLSLDDRKYLIPSNSGSRTNYANVRGDIWYQNFGYRATARCGNYSNCGIKMHRDDYENGWKIFRSKDVIYDVEKSLKNISLMCPICYDVRGNSLSAAIICTIDA